MEHTDDAQPATPATDNPSEAHHVTGHNDRSQGEHEHHHHRHRRRKNSATLPLLLLSVGVLSVGMIISLAHLYVSEESLAERRTSTQEQAGKITALRRENKELSARLNAAVRTRTPTIHPIQPEQVIPINEGLVKDVLFSLSGTEMKKYYEYRVSLRNSGTEPVKPKLRILFFNRAGVQIGYSAIGSAASDPVPVLSTGEVIAFSGVAGPDPDYGLPTYFMVVAGK